VKGFATSSGKAETLTKEELTNYLLVIQYIHLELCDNSWPWKGQKKIKQIA
jgi:hypothetical protein